MGSKIRLGWTVAFVFLFALNLATAIARPNWFNWGWAVVTAIFVLANFSEWYQSRKEVK